MFSSTRVICSIFIIAGVISRFLYLDSHPYGLDIDEAAILYWAEQSFRGRQFFLYAPEFTRWEMLPGFLHAGVAWMSGDTFRLSPALLGCLEILVLWMFADRILGRTAAWIAAAFLAMSPWHFYYSRIVGTCVGVSLLFLIALLLRDSLNGWAVIRHVGGLFYYTTYRLVILRLIGQYLSQRKWKGVALAVMAVLAAMLLARVSPFLERGAYNFQRPNLHFLKNYFYSLVSPFFPIAEEFSQTTREFMADYVHTGFCFALGGHPPLGWGFAIVSLVAIGWALVRRAAVPKLLRDELLFVGGIWLILGFMGPSLSRFLILVPFLTLPAAWLLDVLEKKSSKWVFATFLFGLLTSTAFSQLEVFQRLGNRQLMEPIFHGRFRDLKQTIDKFPDANPDTAFLITGFGHQAARFWATRSKSYSVLPPLTAKDTEEVLNLSAHGRTQYLLRDESPTIGPSLSGYDYSQRIDSVFARIEARAQILEDLEICADQRKIGRLLKFNWPFRLSG